MCGRYPGATQRCAPAGNELAGVLLTALLLLIGPTPRAAAAVEDKPMDEVEQEFGEPNPKAPAALSRFVFLIGRWRCEARVKSANGEWQPFEAMWLGRFILDGYAIADEYRMTGPSGELIVLGMNFRTYDASKQIWNLKWLNALAGTWVDLGPEEFGGVRFDGQSIIYAFKEPGPPRLIRAPPIQTFPRRISLGKVRNLMTGRPGANSWWSRPIEPKSRRVS